MFRKIILALILVFIVATNANAGLSAVVHNTAGATTLEDSITVSFVVTDSIANLSGLDSIFVAIWNAKGDSVFAAAYITTASEIDSIDLGGTRTVWRWSEQISDIDASGRIGTYTGIIIGVDTLDGAGSEYLDNSGFFSFQLINAEYAALLDSAAFAQAALRPTTAGRALDVTATGEAGIDLDNVNGTLSNAEIETIDVNAVSMDAGTITSTVMATNSIGADELADNGIDAGVIAADAIGASELATNAIGAAEIAPAAITVSEMPTIAYFDTLIYSGHAGPGVWVDKGASNTNTVVGTDGTEKNPVSTFAAARTVADNLGFRRYYITNRSDFTGATDSLTVTHEDWEFIGIGADNNLALDFSTPVDVDGSHFENLGISGGQGGTGNVDMFKCRIGEYKGADGTFDFCSLEDTIFVGASDDLCLDHCHSQVPGNGRPGISFGAGASNLSMRHYSGGVELREMAGTDDASIEGIGQVVVNDDCTSAPITIRGFFTIAPGDAGSSVLTKDATFTRAEADLWVWSNTDTLAVDSSLMGEWLSSGINASLSDANITAIMDSGSNRGMITYDSAAILRLLGLYIIAADSDTSAFYVENTNGNAGRIFSTGGNGWGMLYSGNGSGSGFLASGGSNAAGGQFNAGGGNNPGLLLTGQGIDPSLLLNHATASLARISNSTITEFVLMTSDTAALVDNFWDEDSTGHYTSPNMAFIASRTSAGGLDSGIVARIVGRKVWGIPAGSGDDSTAIADRKVAGVDITSISGDTDVPDSLKDMLNGNRATLFLNQLTIVAPDGNKPAIVATGNGSGEGALFTGGATNANGILALGQGNGSGLVGSGGSGTGHGIEGVSGAGATGDGIHAEALSTNGNGLGLAATGSGEEITSADLVDANWDEDSTGHYTSPNMAFVASQTSAGGLDSGIVSRVVGRKVWGIASGSGSDSSTMAQRRVDSVRFVEFVDSVRTLGSFGSGLRAVTIFTANSADTSAIPGISFEIRNQSGVAIAASFTDVNGEFVLALTENDTILVISQGIPNWNFPGDSASGFDSIFVTQAGDFTDTIFGTVLSVTAPSSSDLIRLYAFPVDAGNNKVSGARIIVELKGENIQDGRTGSPITNYVMEGTVSNAADSGFTFVDVIKSRLLLKGSRSDTTTAATVRYKAGLTYGTTKSWMWNDTTPDSSSFKITRYGN